MMSSVPLKMGLFNIFCGAIIDALSNQIALNKRTMF